MRIDANFYPSFRGVTKVTSAAKKQADSLAKNKEKIIAEFNRACDSQWASAVLPFSDGASIRIASNPVEKIISFVLNEKMYKKIDEDLIGLRFSLSSQFVAKHPELYTEEGLIAYAKKLQNTPSVDITHSIL